MKRGRAIAGVVFLAAVAAFFALRPREPVYGGKRLSEWLHELDKDTFTEESRAQATEAVRRIGTNGIPFMERMLSHDPWLRRALIELSGKQSLIRLHLTTAEERRRLALEGIEALGPLARPLIPKLTEMLKDDSSWQAMSIAFVGLARIGLEAVLPLTQALTNASPKVRSAAVISLSMLSSNAQAAVPALVERLESDKDNRVRALAANVLGGIRSEPVVAVPALVKHLSGPDTNIRVEAALALGKFGRQAQEAVPALVKTMKDENLNIRSVAAAALKEIDPDAAAEAGVE
jgi:HEAT repeat protein